MTLDTTPLMQRLPRPFANSEISAFKRCRRKWWLGQFRGLRLRKTGPTGAAELGTRIHTALALKYDPSSGLDTAEDVLAHWETETLDLMALYQEEGEHVLKDIEKESDLGRIMLEGYFEWLEETGADSDLEIVSVERNVEADVPGYRGPRPVKLVGKLDLQVRKHSSGARFFLDHKSVANMTDLPKRADIDEQFLHYDLLELLDHLAQGDTPEASFVGGGIFNMLRKVKRSARANPPFYKREEVTHSLGHLRSYWTRVVGEMAEIQRTEDRLAAGEDPLAVAYPTPHRDCDWDCQFRSVCPMLDDPASDSAAFLDTVYEVGDPLARYKEGLE